MSTVLNEHVSDHESAPDAGGVARNSEWAGERLDLHGYLSRLGLAVRPPSREGLAELHEAHVRRFTFDNIDVLLGQHPGIGIEAVNEKFVARGRGGYCFEHTTILAAALEGLGYQVTRRLARVGDPDRGEQQGRTHMLAEVNLDGQRLLCDPGFGKSILRPIPLIDGAEDDYLGWAHRVRLTESGTWRLERRRDGGWEVSHAMDELPVQPSDILVGHHFTSTFPGSHFRNGLVLAGYLADRHVTVTHDALTVRHPGEPTEHRPLEPGELAHWLDQLEVPLTEEERVRLLTWASDA